MGHALTHRFTHRDDQPAILTAYDFLAACQVGSESAALKLLQKGLAVSSCTRAHETLLEIALRHHQESSARALLVYGADPWQETHVLDDEGRCLRLPPFESAIALGMLKFTQDCLNLPQAPTLREREEDWLLHLEAHIHPAISVWRRHSTYLHLACASKNPQLIQFLIQQHCTVQLDYYGGSPLQACCLLHSGLDCAVVLLQAGFDPRMPDCTGRSPLSTYPTLLTRYLDEEREHLLSVCISPSEAPQRETSL